MRRCAPTVSLRAGSRTRAWSAKPVCLGPLAVDCDVAARPGCCSRATPAGFVDPMTGDGLRFALRGGGAGRLRSAACARARRATAPSRLLAGAPPRVRAKWRFNRACDRWSAPGAVRAAGYGAAVLPALLQHVDPLRWRRPRRLMFALLLLALAFVPMLLETRLRGRHDRALRAAGALEPADDVYPLMQVAYPACFLAMVFEAWARGSASNLRSLAGVGVFALAQGDQVLGDRDARRPMDVPRARAAALDRDHRRSLPVSAASELRRRDGGACRNGGHGTGADCRESLSIAGFGALMLLRIRVEERELGGDDPAIDRMRCT